MQAYHGKQYEVGEMRPGRRFENFDFWDLAASADVPRFSVTVLDPPVGGGAGATARTCAVFFVPPGREAEYQFATEDGLRGIALQVRLAGLDMPQPPLHQLTSRHANSSHLCALQVRLARLDMRPACGPRLISRHTNTFLDRPPQVRLLPLGYPGTHPHVKSRLYCGVGVVCKYRYAGAVSASAGGAVQPAAPVSPHGPAAEGAVAHRHVAAAAEHAG